MPRNDKTKVKQSGKPLMSCIILLTLNDDFVERRLIPSITNNSTNHTTEIIVVCNGYDKTTINSHKVDIVLSPFLWVSKGYNTGVKRARGEHIAIFHDDCVLDDNQWIEKATTMLDEATIAVSPEFDGNAAKCVPLVLKQANTRGQFPDNLQGSAGAQLAC